MRSFWGCLVLAAAMVAACNSTTVVEPTGAGGSGGSGGSGAGASSSTGAGGGSGGCSLHGDCMTDEDCAGDTQCVPLTACGFKVCEQPIAEATMCGDPNMDSCCDSSECEIGSSCYQWPWGPYCGGVQPPVFNQCTADECQADSDCPQLQPPYQSICTPSQVLGFPVRVCLTATCQGSWDCTEEPGGVCAPVQTACCSSENILACVYPSDGCRSGADCSGDSHCDIDGAAARCLDGPAICPA